MFHLGTFDNFKHYYDNFKHYYLHFIRIYLKRDFPDAVSYNRFVELERNRSGVSPLIHANLFQTVPIADAWRILDNLLDAPHYSRSRCSEAPAKGSPLRPRNMS